MLFFAKIENSKLKIFHPEHLDIFLKKIINCPEVTVDIKKKRRTRTNEQNKYYWGYIGCEGKRRARELVQAGLIERESGYNLFAMGLIPDKKDGKFKFFRFVPQEGK